MPCIAGSPIPAAHSLAWGMMAAYLYCTIGLSVIVCDDKCGHPLIGHRLAILGFLQRQPQQHFSLLVFQRLQQAMPGAGTQAAMVKKMLHMAVQVRSG